MAKYKMEIEDGAVKRTLEFKGKVFDFTMPKAVNGRSKANKPTFEAQLKKAFENKFDEADLEMILEAADQINFGDDSDVVEALEELSGYEE